MSALLQSAAFPSIRGLSEADASLALAEIGSQTADLNTTLDRSAATLLSVRGILRLSIEPGPALAAHLGSHPQWGHLPLSPRTPASVTVAIRAANWYWGRLRIDFHLRELASDDPLALARFAAQQIACYLNLQALRNERQILLHQKHRHEDRLYRRKLATRALGILADVHGISQRQAFRIFVDIVRSTRRSPWHVAESIILAAD